MDLNETNDIFGEHFGSNTELVDLVGGSFTLPSANRFGFEHEAEYDNPLNPEPTPNSDSEKSPEASNERAAEDEDEELPVAPAAPVHIKDTMNGEEYEALLEVEKQNAKEKVFSYPETPISDVKYNEAGKIMLNGYRKSSSEILRELRKKARLNEGQAISFKDIVSQTFTAEYFTTIKNRLNLHLKRPRLVGDDEVIKFVRVIIILKARNCSFEAYLKRFTKRGLELFKATREDVEEFLQMTKDRFNELLKALNSPGGVEAEEVDYRCVFPPLADVQYISDLEQLVTKIFRRFVSGSEYLLFDNDKIEKVVKRWNDVGIQTSGFRGCHRGPTMHGGGDPMCMIIAMVRFARKNENCTDVVKICLRALYNAQDDKRLKENIPTMLKIFADRGYLTYELVNYILCDLGASCAGTAQQNVAAFRGTDQKVPLLANGMRISTTGTKASYAAIQQWSLGNGKKKEVYHLANRMGTGRAGFLFSSIAELHPRVYDINPISQTKLKILDDRFQSHEVQKYFVKVELLEEDEKRTIIETVKNWVDDNGIIELCSVQATTPWFELRSALITGTTGKNFLRVAKVELAKTVPNAKKVLEFLGHRVHLLAADDPAGFASREEHKKEIEALTPLQVLTMAKEVGKLPSHIKLKDAPLYNASGSAFKSIKSASTKKRNLEDLQKMRDALLNDPEPDEKSIMEMLCASLALRSSHTKNKQYPDGRTAKEVDHMSIGKKREPEIRKRMPSLVKDQSKHVLKYVWSKEYGLLTSRKGCKGIAVSPDNMCVLRADFSTPEWQVTDRRAQEKLQNDLGTELFTDLIRFAQFLNTEMNFDLTKPVHFMACEEYKTKTAQTTMEQASDIQRILNSKFRVLHFTSPLVKEVVGQYMDQLFHQVSVTGCPFVVFAVAARDDFSHAILIYFHTNLLTTYLDMHKYLQKKYLHWLYEDEESEKFDKFLSRMPDTEGIDFKHMVDRNTLKIRIQIAQYLIEMADLLQKPLPSFKHVQPLLVVLWNKIKGLIDDFSAIVKKCLGLFSGLDANGIGTLRITDVIASNTHRLMQIRLMEEHVDNIDTWEAFINKRNSLGHTYVDSLREIAVVLETLRLSSQEPIETEEDLVRYSCAERIFKLGLHKPIGVTREKWNEPDYVALRNDGGKHEVTSCESLKIIQLQRYVAQGRIAIQTPRDVKDFQRKSSTELDQQGALSKGQQWKQRCKYCYAKFFCMDDENCPKQKPGKPLRCRGHETGNSQTKACGDCGVFLHRTQRVILVDIGQNGESNVVMKTVNCEREFHSGNRLPKLPKKVPNELITRFESDEISAASTYTPLASSNGQKRRRTLGGIAGRGL